MIHIIQETDLHHIILTILIRQIEEVETLGMAHHHSLQDLGTEATAQDLTEKPIENARKESITSGKDIGVNVKVIEIDVR